MDAGNLVHKTHLKRHSTLPDAHIKIFDLEKNHDEIIALTRLSDIAPPALENQILPDYTDFKEPHDILRWALLLVNESPLAMSLLEKAKEEGWSVGMADLHGGGFYLDIPEKEILLDHYSMDAEFFNRSVYFQNAFITTFIRALRDVWHEENARHVCEEEYGPEDVLMIERVRAADCDAVTIMAAWELRGAGYSDIWRHLIGAAEGDMALTFTQFLERDPTSLYDGSALAYAFRQWYMDGNRVDSCDHDTLESLDDVLLGADEHNPFGQKVLEGHALEDLSVLPDGTCYLAGLGQTIMNDPYFAGLHDPINQSHLFQLVYDTEVTMVNNVPFRDDKLARKIFPESGNIKRFR